MVVLYGRRRVGKTALTKEFARDKPALVFTAKIHLDAALAFIAQQAKDTHLVFVFDEFLYAAKRNASLISTFQIACDRLFPETGIFLILTGSNQGFMEEKVLGDTDEDSLGEKNPLFGRRTAQIHLGPFGYRDAALMLPGLSSTELVEFYAVFGGTPYYLSMIDASESLKANAERLFFRKEGLLYEEPMMLLRQELHEPAIYSSVLDAIAAGANKPQEIAGRIGEDRGPVGRYLKTLQSMRFVEKKVPYGEPREKSRKGICCISEPVFSFWYRFVQPAMDAIEMDAGELEARELFEGNGIPTYVGHWFETICLEWTIAQAKKGDLSDSEAGGEQTLPERGRQASMSWQAASAAASSSSENASGGIHSMREKQRRSLCGGHSSYRATTRFATACSRRTRFQRALLGRLVQSGPSWMQRGSTKNEMACRRFKWAKAGNGRVACIEDRGKKTKRKALRKPERISFGSP